MSTPSDTTFNTELVEDFSRLCSISAPARSSRKAHPKDAARRKRYVEEKIKKANARRRRQGRKGVKPEGEEEEVDLIGAVEKYHGVSNSMSKPIQELAEALDDDSGEHALVAYLVNLVGVVTSLSTCDSSTDVAMVLIGSLTQHVSARHIKAMESLISADDCDIPEVGRTVRSALQQLKELKCTFYELPFYGLLQKFFAVSYYLKLFPEEAINDDTARGLLYRLTDLHRDKSADLIDAVLDIGLFVIDIADAISHGESIRTVLLPRTVHTAYSELVSQKVDYLNGVLEDVHGISKDAYSNNLYRTICDLRLAINKRTTVPALANVYTKYLVDLETVRQDLEAYDRSFKLRKSPFAIYLYSDTARGKSTMIPSIYTAIGKECGFSTDQESIYYFSPGKEYEDGLTNSKNIAVMDEVFNSKQTASTGKEEILHKIHGIINNVPTQTNQAAIELKGKIFYDFKLLIATGNRESMGAEQVSICPLSITRRFAVMLEVRVKEQYAFPKGHSRVGQLNPSSIGVYEGLQPPLHDVKFYTMKPHHGNALRREDLSDWMCLTAALPEITRLYKNYSQNQEQILGLYDALKDAPWCSNCQVYESWCSCSKIKEVEPEGLTDFINYVVGTPLYLDFIRHLSSWKMSPIHNGFCNFIKKYFPYFVVLYFKTLGVMSMKYQLGFLFGIFGFSCFGTFAVFTVMGFPFGLCYLVFCGYVFYEITCAMVVTSTRIVGRLYFLRLLKNPRRAVLALSGAMALAYSAFEMVRRIRRFHQKTIEPEGLRIQTRAEYTERLGEKDVWLKVEKSKILGDHALSTMTLDQAVSTVSRNIARAELKAGEKQSRCTAVLLNNNNVMLTYHGIKDFMEICSCELHDLEIEAVINRGEDSINSKVYTTLYGGVRVQGKDFTIFKSTKSIFVKPLAKFLPNRVETTCAVMIRRKRDGTIDRSNLLFKPAIVTNNFIENGVPLQALGSSHSMSVITSGGDCLSPIVSMTAPHYVIGFHMGGNGGGHGTAFTILSQDLNFNKLRPEGFVEWRGIDNCDHDGNVLVTLGDGHERECVRYLREKEDTGEKFPYCEYLGYDSSKRITPKTHVNESRLSPSLTFYGRPNRHHPPNFRSDRDHAAAFQVKSRGMRSFPPRILRTAIIDYVKPILEACEKFKPLGGSLSYDETLNGVPGDRYIKAIDITTSGGLGYSGIKKKHLRVDYTAHARYVSMHPNQIRHCDALLDRLAKGEVYSPMVKSALKDEPTTKDKVRVFTVFPMHHFFVGKKLTARIISFLYNVSLLSEMLQGSNVMGPEWGDLKRHIIDYSPTMCLEGDYSKYDQRISEQLIMAAADVLMILAKKMDYDSKDIVAIKTYVSELALNAWVYNGSIFLLSGVNPSGCYLTILINGIVNSLIHRCVFYIIKPPDCKGAFRDYVRLATVGDDSIGSSSVGWFNMNAISKVLALYDLPYTDASKSTVVPKFYDFNKHELTFCKRRFVFNERLEIWEAPLDLLSIYRALHNYMDSDTDELTICVQVVEAMIVELSRHNEEVFEEEIAIIRKSCEKISIDHMVRNLYTSKQRLDNERYKRFFVQSLPEEQDIEVSSDVVPESAGLESSKCNILAKNYTRALAVITLVVLLLSHLLRACIVPATYIAERHNPPVSVINKIWITDDRNVNKKDDNLIEETLGFSTNTNVWTSGMSSETDPTMMLGETDLTNDGFLARPYRIATVAWGVGQDIFTIINPWDEFFLNPQVSNRIAHYKNMRACLRVRFQLNGNKLYYGRLMCSYVPLASGDTVSLARSGVLADFIEASQRPHVLLDPTSSQGGELCLPFIFPKNFADIPSSDWKKLGVFVIQTLNPLQHSQGITDAVTVTIMANCETYSLNTPTGHTQDAITPQAWEEYGGMISQPAHTLANWAGNLSKVPIIGKYARATQIVSTAVGKAASLFGFSKPVNPDNFAKAVVYSRNLATTAGTDSSMPMSVDPKKEITVDPRVVGASPMDEMAVAHLASKQCFVGSFDWSVSNPIDDHLFSIRVRPTQGVSETVGSRLEYHMTPSSWVAMLAEYWKGSMLINFKVVCNMFHKGRLRIVWDPNFPIGDNNFNTAFTRIVDISDVTDVGIKIGWGQNFSYMPTGVTVNGSPLDIFPSWSPSPFTSVDPTANGTLSVYVMNELTTAGTSGETVSVNVYTSMCDDFEINSLSDFYLSLYRPLLSETPLDGGEVVDTVVQKNLNAWAILRGSYSAADAPRYVESPQWSNAIGVVQGNFPPLITSGPEGYIISLRGATGGSPNTPVTFTFNNPSANARDITVSLNTGGGSVTAMGTLAPNIGATVSITVVVDVPEGRQEWPMSIDATGTGGRILLQTIEGPFANDEIFEFLSPTDIAAITPMTVDPVADDAVGADNLPITIPKPANAAVGGPGTIVMTRPFSITDQDGTQDFSSTTQFAETNAVAVPFKWGPSGITLNEPSTASATTPWFASTYGIYYLGSTQPQGFEEVPDFAHQGPVYPQLVPAPLHHSYQASGPFVYVTEQTHDNKLFCPKCNHPLYTTLAIKSLRAAPSDVRPEAEEEDPASQNSNVPDSAAVVYYMAPDCEIDATNQVYFGEYVASLRTVMKRFVTVWIYRSQSFIQTLIKLPDDPTIPFEFDDGNRIISKRQTISHMEWIIPSFVTKRGGIRVTLSSGINPASTNIGNAYMTRLPYNVGGIPSWEGGSVLPISSFNGTIAGSLKNSGILECELPYYSRYRFVHARNSSFSDPNNFIERQLLQIRTGTSTGSSVAFSYATAEDFSLSHFLSTPVFVNNV